MSSSRNPPDPVDRPSSSADAKPADRPPRRRGWGPFRFVLGYTRAVIVDQHLRRMTMFYVVIAAMVMAFCGDLFLSDWLDFRHHIGRFAVYWLVCGWLTVLAALLAVYDLLLLRIQHRLLRRALRARMLAEETEEKEEG